MEHTRYVSKPKTFSRRGESTVTKPNLNAPLYSSILLCLQNCFHHAAALYACLCVCLNKSIIRMQYTLCRWVGNRSKWRGGQQQQAAGGQNPCSVCYDATTFHLICCNCYTCTFCLHKFVLCTNLSVGSIVPLANLNMWPLGNRITRHAYVHTTKFPLILCRDCQEGRQGVCVLLHLQDLEVGKDPRVLKVVHLAPPEGLSGPVQAGDPSTSFRGEDSFLVDHTIQSIIYLVFFYYY